MLPFIFAILAMLSNGTAGEFNQGVLQYCEPVYIPGTFIGCEALDPTQDETLYAGLVWQETDNVIVPTLVTGP